MQRLITNLTACYMRRVRRLGFQQIGIHHMKILLFCPLNPNPPRLWRRTAESILKIQWPDPIDYWLTANDNPFDKPYLITHQYNKARDMVLTGGYDALLCVESDMIVPLSTLARLAACDSDVAYGLYVFRHTRHNWSAYTEMERTWGRSLSENQAEARKQWGSVIDVSGVGMGCTLIRRNALELVKFRLDDDRPDKTSCDWSFALDVASEGLLQRCDLGVVCGHISYKPYPMILWPDQEEPRLYRRETLEGVTMTPIKAGDQFHVGMGETILASANG